MTVAEIHLADTDENLNPSSGELHGLFDSRDQVLGGFSNQLDSFAQTLIYEFNKVYSSGQGLTGYSTLTALLPSAIRRNLLTTPVWRLRRRTEAFRSWSPTAKPV